MAWLTGSTASPDPTPLDPVALQLALRHPRAALKTHVRNEIGPIATPEFIQFTDGLPKTSSGKIMRRILRKIAASETEAHDFGDTSTLADPTVVDTLVSGSKAFVK